MVTVSQKEFQRVKGIENGVGGRLSVSEAARLLQLSERQVQRLERRYRPDSVAWVHHGNRGRPMPWALPAVLRRTLLELAHGKYAGFNASHLWEKTADRGELGGQPRDRAPHPACRQAGLSAEAPPSPVPRPPLAPSPLRHDGAHRRQPS